MCDPKNDMNAFDDYFELVTKAHIVVAGMKTFSMKEADNRPVFPSDVSTETKSAVIQSAVKAILSNFVDLSFPAKSISKKRTKSLDHVHEYGKDVLTMGLLFLEFKDAIREGDGERVLRCWKFMFLYFRTGHTSYALEAFSLLCHYHYLLPPRYAEQLIWSHFVNTHGHCGKNISADLHMEHLNRVCKDAVTYLGANKTPNAIVRIGKAVGTISNIHSTTLMMSPELAPLQENIVEDQMRMI